MPPFEQKELALHFVNCNESVRHLKLLVTPEGSQYETHKSPGAHHDTAGLSSTSQYCRHMDAAVPHHKRRWHSALAYILQTGSQIVYQAPC